MGVDDERCILINGEIREKRWRKAQRTVFRDLEITPDSLSETEEFKYNKGQIETEGIE